MISWRWRGHVYYAAYAIVYIRRYHRIYSYFYYLFIFKIRCIYPFIFYLYQHLVVFWSISIIFTFIYLSYSTNYKVYLFFITFIYGLHYITLHYITLHYITLHYITLHYITLHYCDRPATDRTDHRFMLLYLYILTFYFSLLYFNSYFLHPYLGFIADYPRKNTTLLHAITIYIPSRTLPPHISLFYYLFTGRGVYRMLSEMIFYTFYFYFFLSFPLLKFSYFIFKR